MKRVLIALLAVCMLLGMLPVSAMASAPATPNQTLAFRTGPNTKYVELYSLPQSTYITAIEYEEGNGVTWVLVEFTYQGQTVRAYTGLKRMSVHGNIPWANHAWTPVVVNTAGQVYAAPGSNAANRGRVISGETVELLGYEGSYAYIEFYDGSNGATSRGYIPDWMISGEGNYDSYVPEYDYYPEYQQNYTPSYNNYGVQAYPNQTLAFRTGPNTKYVELYSLPQSTNITAIEYEEGNGVTWVLVEFYKDGQRVRAYTGLKRMSVGGNIPWANHAWTPAVVNAAGQVYAAPGYDAAYRGKVVAGETVEFLRYDGDFAYIEFYDGSSRATSRGWIPSHMIGGGYSSGSTNSSQNSRPTYSSGTNAVLNQSMALRTGPNTQYVEMYTLPQSTSITALEYEEGNGATWVLVEFFKDGKRVRGYTGLKRMSVHGNIPWANWDAMGTGFVRGGGTVYAAPSSDAAYRATLRDYAPITLLDFSGDYAYVEFTDPATGMPSRGYIGSYLVVSD